MCVILLGPITDFLDSGSFEFSQSICDHVLYCHIRTTLPCHSSLTRPIWHGPFP